MTSDDLWIASFIRCHCDRYWNFLTRCRMPMLQHMELPFGCPMDSLCVLMVLMVLMVTDEP